MHNNCTGNCGITLNHAITHDLFSTSTIRPPGRWRNPGPGSGDSRVVLGIGDQVLHLIPTAVLGSAVRLGPTETFC